MLAGGCRRAGQEPFAPLVQALADGLRQRQPEGLAADLQGCAWLVRLLPELAGGPIEPLPPWTLSPEQERRLIHEALVRFLRNVTGPRGTLLLLDDLQWAGADALELLGEVLRAEVPVRVVGAYRDSDVGPQDPLVTTLADLAHVGLVRHHSLAPLGEEDGAALLARALAEAGDASGTTGTSVPPQQVVRRLGGIPFFILSYAQGLLQRETAAALTDQLAPADVPWDVTQSVRQRVAALPEAARAVLGVAAVAGRPTPEATLLAAALQGEEEGLVALDGACRARLLLDEAAGYRCAHDVIREVVEAELGTARRRVLHRRLAAAIEAQPALCPAEHDEVLAHHYLQGEVWEKARDYLVLAADKALAAGALREALAAYTHGLALCERLGERAGEAAATIAQKRGFVCFDIGDFAGAAANFEQVHAIASGRGDRRGAGMALAYRGMAELFGHAFEAAETSLRAALALAEPGLDDVRLTADVLLGDLLLSIGRHVEAAQLLREAEELAPRSDDTFIRLYLSSVGLTVRSWSGRFDEACAFADRWRDTVVAQGAVLTMLLQGFFEALAYGGRGQYERALTLLHRLLGMCETIGEDFTRARLLNSIGWVHAELEGHEQALVWNRQSMELAQSIHTEDPEILNNARLNLGDNLRALGQPDEAEAQYLAVEQVVRRPRPQDRFMLWRYTQHLFHSYGELWLERGDAERALAYADECLALAESSDSRKNIVKARRLRGQVFLVQGRLDEAEFELDQALELARQVGNPPQLWKTLLSVRALRHAQGRATKAGQTHDEARSVVEGVAAGLSDTLLRERFLRSARIQAILSGTSVTPTR